MQQINKTIILAWLILITGACVDNSRTAIEKNNSTENIQLNIIEMAFTGDCWILVKNIDENTNVITGIQTADSKLKLKLLNNHNYKIFIGYPSRVTITLNDRPIELKARSEKSAVLLLNQGMDRFSNQ